MGLLSAKVVLGSEDLEMSGPALSKSLEEKTCFTLKLYSETLFVWCIFSCKDKRILSKPWLG